MITDCVMCKKPLLKGKILNCSRDCERAFKFAAEAFDREQVEAAKDDVLLEYFEAIGLE